MTFKLPPEKQWLTAAEAAAAELPDVPASKRHLNRLITQRGIKLRKRTARGGGREFHWSDLPAAARAEWLKRHGELQNALHDGAGASRAVSRDLVAEARSLITESAAAFHADRALTKAKGLSVFCKAYEKRRVKLDEWVFRAVPAIEPHQLRTWARLLKNGGTEALLDRRGRKPGSGLFERDLKLRSYTIAAVAARPHLSARSVSDQISTDLGREIPLRTVQLFLSTLKDTNAPMLKALSNPDKWRSHHQPAYGSLSRQIVRINQRWEIDASPADAMCLVDGKPRRVKLTACIDVFTRRARVLVSEQPTAIATMALLARCVRDFGLPEVMKADNGKEFRSRAVEAFCRDLGIAVDWSKPFHPEEKPHIERFFGTLQHELFETLQGYLGHNVADRQAIEARRSFAHRFGEEADFSFGVPLTPAELQARIDVWLLDVYEQRSHGGIKMPPFAKAATHAADAKLLADERVLDTLLLPAPGNGGLRVVAKKGIAIFGRKYVSGDLGTFSGQQVSVRYDAHDPSRIVVYSRDGLTFLCVAFDQDSLSDRDLMTHAVAAKGNARRMVTETRRDIARVQQLYPSATAGDRVLLAASKGVDLTDDARDMMQAASPPRLVARTEAMDEAERPAAHIAPTDEEAEGAAIILAEFATQTAAPRQGIEQCDGYERPSFMGDDVGFWIWALGHVSGGKALDAFDAAEFARLSNDMTFQHLLSVSAPKRAGSAA